jgi:hypothetical protein
MVIPFLVSAFLIWIDNSFGDTGATLLSSALGVNSTLAKLDIRCMVFYTAREDNLLNL